MATFAERAPVLIGRVASHVQCSRTLQQYLSEVARKEQELAQASLSQSDALARLASAGCGNNSLQQFVQLLVTSTQQDATHRHDMGSSLVLAGSIVDGDCQRGESILASLRSTNIQQNPDEVAHGLQEQLQEQSRLLAQVLQTASGALTGVPPVPSLATSMSNLSWLPETEALLTPLSAYRPAVARPARVAGAESARFALSFATGVKDSKRLTDMLAECSGDANKAIKKFWSNKKDEEVQQLLVDQLLSASLPLDTASGSDRSASAPAAAPARSTPVSPAPAPAPAPSSSSGSNAIRSAFAAGDRVAAGLRMNTGSGKAGNKLYASHGVAEDQNVAHKDYMEDGNIVVESLDEEGSMAFFGVYDGHSGKEAVDIAIQHLHLNLLKEIKAGRHPQQAFHNAYLATDKQIKAAGILKSGCTSVTALLMRKTVAGKLTRTLHVANAGDSRAVLCDGGQARRMSYDHKASDPDEEKRVIAAGGTMLWGRVQGQTMVSRSLGDWELKDYVIADPYYSEITLESSHKFLILACDGVWDVLSDAQAVTHIFKDSNATKMAQKLVNHSIDQKSEDNLTAMVVLL